MAASIERVLDCQGSLAAMLVERATGFAHTSSGDESVLPDSAEAAEDFHLAYDILASTRTETELESVVVTTAERHYVTQAVPGGNGDDLLLVVVLDRARTNIALAGYQIGDHAKALSA
ncbi:hypothetical protein [Nocardiopsis ansamitocini]|nr:hypothetical protein [Nocardiopsis ansamitocini]